MLSVYAKDPRERSIADEIEDAKDFLDTLKEEFGVPIYWKFGNHEERFDHYIYRNADQLGFVKKFTLEAVMDLEKYNCTVIKDKRIIKIGHLNVIHGHEFGMGFLAPVNPARTFFLRAKAPTIGGDKHTTSEHSGRTINRKLITCWSIGCLCYSADTEVLTDAGFVRFDNLLQSQNIAEYDPATEAILYRKPLAYQRYDYSGKMHLFQSSRLDLLVTPEHKMLHFHDTIGGYQTSTAEELSNYHTIKIPNSGRFVGDSAGLSPDEARLLSWIITEGSVDISHKTSLRISIYQKKPHRVREIKAVLMRMGIKSSITKDKRNGVLQFRLPVKETRRVFGLGLSHNIRRIPRRLLNSRINVLRACYETLIAGDGHRNPKGTDYFATKHLELAEDFQELCTKIGYSVRIIYDTSPTNYAPNGASIYRCKVRKSSYVTVAQRKVVDYNGEVFDITTTTGFFVVRRNGNVAISGNCDLKPRYRPINEWNHGFAYVTNEDKTFRVMNMRIEDGQVY